MTGLGDAWALLGVLVRRFKSFARVWGPRCRAFASQRLSLVLRAAAGNGEFERRELDKLKILRLQGG